MSVELINSGFLFYREREIHIISDKNIFQRYNGFDTNCKNSIGKAVFKRADS